MLNSIEVVQMPKNLLLQGWEKKNTIKLLNERILSWHCCRSCTRRGSDLVFCLSYPKVSRHLPPAHLHHQKLGSRWLWRKEHENPLAPFSPDILVCPDRNTSVASSAPGQKEDSGKLCATRAGRHHTRSEGTAAGRDQQRSANVEYRMSLLPHQIHCSFPLCPRLLI